MSESKIELYYYLSSGKIKISFPSKVEHVTLQIGRRICWDCSGYPKIYHHFDVNNIFIQTMLLKIVESYFKIVKYREENNHCPIDDRTNEKLCVKNFIFPIFKNFQQRNIILKKS
jgi:hypothetical protein